jgi:hypothetical protein
MKVFCCECGRPVPMHQDPNGQWIAAHCRRHPTAKRFKESAAKKWFAEIHKALDALTDCPGRVFNGGPNYWSVLETRVRKAQGGAL